MQPLDFWFDFASPYSYVAAMRIESLCSDAGVPLRWRPFLLAPIFESHGAKHSPMLDPARNWYMWRDLERLSVKYGIPWRKPTAFPRNTVLPARVAAAHGTEPWCADFVRATFVANFGFDRDIGHEDAVASILVDIGRPPSAITLAIDDEHRGLLRGNIEQAIAIGIFGAPNCVVGNELFWGEDAVDDAIRWACNT
jgi:2-hydroxychromene-2-carboxylate isomerase